MKRSYGAHKTVCACCGAMVERYDICEVCGWQDDNVQNNDPDYRGGANTMSLNEAKEAYRKGEKMV
ncbi:MAG TPA: CPCC family cysteine-rich protein [Fervidobacterium sp.]|nr:CPCC family cysteine-rich protein [Fervidobacterium sp.]